MAAGSWGGGEKGEWLLADLGFFGRGDENVLKLDGGNGCTTLNTLKNTDSTFLKGEFNEMWHLNKVILKNIKND